MLKKISLCNITSSCHHYFFFSCISGEVLGFENLVFSVFEFLCGLTETPKSKKTVKKFLDELIYFLVLYMQITEEQVGFVFRFCIQPIISSLFCTYIPNNRWLLDSCQIDQTITFFCCYLPPSRQVWASNPNQFAEDEDDDTFSFSVRISVQDVLLVSEWNSFNIQFTPSVLVRTPFSYGADLLCYN